MNQLEDALIPVIVAVGEIMERPDEPKMASEPVVLMAQAIRAAEADAKISLLGEITSVELVGQVTWRYRDPAGLLCEKLGINPPRKINASMGGETPVRLIHEAALRIARGEGGVEVIVGGEAVNAVSKARKAKVALEWTPLVAREDAARVDFEQLPLSRSSKKAGVTDPVHIYPFYENALQAAQGKTPAQGRKESAALWSRYAAVAATNDNAWIRTPPTAEEIATPSSSNRSIAFPYTKLNVANPSVNQAGAVVVASLAWARSAGIAEDRLVYIWGGAAAQEPGDYLLRDAYDHSTAQSAVLQTLLGMVARWGATVDLAELYSCFPVVPKLAARTLNLPDGVEPTVAGGLTFFGGPLNNYMTHAVCAMVRRLRAAPTKRALVYGQGGVVTKHHAILLSGESAPEAISLDYSVQDRADSDRGPVPELIESYTGPAKVETYTVLYGADGAPLHGVVILRSPVGQRLIARVRADDETSLNILTSEEHSAVGASGHVRIDAFGQMVWELGELRDRRLRQLRYCTVERQDRVTIVTINRPEAMNALHPYINEELDEIFDAFLTDPDQWVAILTGAGDKAFSSGNDLKFFANAMRRGASVDQPRNGFAGLTSRWNIAKPIIAAVNGVAMGGGFEIALACDIVVASDNATFALPEPKVGLAALAGGLQRLPRQIGLKPAMGMILTGRRVTAAEGLSLGFVNEVVPLGELLTAARRWADEIVAASPMSVRASKEAVMLGLDETVQSAFSKQFQSPAMSALFRSADFREGPLAFAEKRAPRWKGR